MWRSSDNDGNAALPVQRRPAERQALLGDRQAQVAAGAAGQTVAVSGTPPDDQERETEGSEGRAWNEPPPPRATAVRLRRWAAGRCERLRGGHDDADRHRDGAPARAGTRHDKSVIARRRHRDGERELRGTT